MLIKEQQSELCKQDIKGRNQSIDIFRLVCSLLVVTIHSKPFSEYSVCFSHFLSDIMARVAVPFFFVVSGYYLSRKIEKKTLDVKKTISKYAKIYTIWSIIWILLGFVEAISDHNIVTWAHNLLPNFFIHGTIDVYWFFPALIYATILLFLCAKLSVKFVFFSSLTLYAIGLLGQPYYTLGIKIPGINTLFQWEYYNDVRHIFLTAYPFMSLGFMLNLVKEKNNTKSKAMPVVLLTIFILFISEIILIEQFELQNGYVTTIFLYPLVGMIFLFCCQNPGKCKSEGKRNRRIATFVYLAHPLAINACLFLNSHTSLTISPTMLFVFTVASTCGSGIIITKSKKLSAFLLD